MQITSGFIILIALREKFRFKMKCENENHFMTNHYVLFIIIENNIFQLNEIFFFSIILNQTNIRVWVPQLNVTS